ncbi:hypothetical protein PTKIN_Ptkin13bG0232100 [Pterospermum kingtungense]
MLFPVRFKPGGEAMDMGFWHFLVPLLAYYFKVVVFDMVFSPNVNPKLYNPIRYTSHLNGYADDLICLLDQLHVKNTIYLGHSMSAMVGCVAATKRPLLFTHLILLGGSPRYINDEGYDGGFERSDINDIYQSIDKNSGLRIKDFAPKAVGVNNTATIAEFENSLRRMKPGIALSAGKTVFSSDLRKKLPKVVVPCTIIQSKKDYVVPVSVAYYMKSKLGGPPAQVKILDTQGHFPHLTAYNLLFKVLKEALQI